MSISTFRMPHIVGWSPTRKRRGALQFSVMRLVKRRFDRRNDLARRKEDSTIENFISNRGGVLTDELEREISRKFGRMAG